MSSTARSFLIFICLAVLSIAYFVWTVQPVF